MDLRAILLITIHHTEKQNNSHRFVHCFAALVLAVTVYGITRQQNGDLAMLALACRVAEGVIAGSSMPRMQALGWLADRERRQRAGAIGMILDSQESWRMAGR